jgi:hypothetical protein
LLNLCERAFRRRTIQKLTDTYMTLSLEEIAKAVELGTDDEGLKEVEQEILGMVSWFGLGCFSSSLPVTRLDERATLEGARE